MQRNKQTADPGGNQAASGKRGTAQEPATSQRRRIGEDVELGVQRLGCIHGGMIGFRGRVE